MENELANKYDKIYTRWENKYGEPDLIMKQALELIKNGSVLDLGSGDGRHSILAASEGFEVTAVDFSKVAIEKIKTAGQRNKLKIKTMVVDISNYQLEDDYNLLVSIFVFHNLSKEEAIKVIESIKQHTKDNGINLIRTFTEASDFFETENPGGDKFYPKAAELKRMYEGWEILNFNTCVVKVAQQAPDGSAQKNQVVEILAKKIK